MRALLLLLPLLSSTTVAAQKQAEAQALPDRPRLEVTLGDLAAPQVFEVKRDRHNLTIKQTGAPRTVAVRAFFGQLESTALPGWRTMLDVTAAETTIGVLPDRDAAMFVVFSDAATRDTAPLVLGRAPTADDTLSAWELQTRALMIRAQPASAPAPRFTPEQLATLWLHIDEAWIVYAQKKACGGQVEAGEPLLVLGAYTQNPRPRPGDKVWSARLLRANGATVPCLGPDELSAILAKRPATVTMPPAFAHADTPEDFWSEEDFVSFADSDPAIAKFLKKKAEAWACAEKEWKRLDPDGRAGHYDVVTRDGEGHVKSVESLWHRTEREVWKACKIAPIEQERTKLTTKLYEKAKQKNAEHLKTVAARFAPKP